MRRYVKQARPCSSSGPKTETDARKLLAKNETDIPVLTDSDGAVMDDYGISFDLPEMLRPMYEARLGFPGRNPATGWRLPVPATFVIDRAGVIRERHWLADYRYRMEPRDILAALEALPSTG